MMSSHKKKSSMRSRNATRLTGVLAGEGNGESKWVSHNFTLETMFQRVADGQYWKSKVVNGVLTFEKGGAMRKVAVSSLCV